MEYFLKIATIEKVCQRISKYIDNIILYYWIDTVDLEEELRAETLFLDNFFEKMITRTKSTFIQKVTSNGRFFQAFTFSSHFEVDENGSLKIENISD